MSVRVYTGRHAGRTRAHAVRAWLPGLLATAAIAAQIAWPLTSGASRDSLTIVSVLLFTAACAAHALQVRGFWWTAGWLCASGGGGLLAEILGTHTGLPFGFYTYADRLGPAVFGVPLVIAAAWAMIAYPCLLAARLLVRGPALTAVVGAWAVMSWDLFLDPQMVAEGHWTWQIADPALYGIPQVPLQNFVGWLLVAFVLMLLLEALPRSRHDGTVPPDGVPAALLAWTYLSNVALVAVIAPRPAVLAWAGISMGLVVVPYLIRVWTTRA